QTVRVVEPVLHVRRGNTHGVAELMTGGAIAAVGPEVLKERTAQIDIAVLIKRPDYACRVAKTGQIRYGGLLSGQTKCPSHEDGSADPGGKTRLLHIGPKRE